jgi:hypothetical protein
MNPYGLIFSYLKSKGTIMSLVGDMIILSGVVFFNWNAARAIGFICLDVYVMIIFFLLFMQIQENFSGTIWKLGGVFIFTSLMLGYFFTIIQIQHYFLEVKDEHLLSDVGKLFYPYYDVGLFVTLAASAHLHTIFKLRKVPVCEAKTVFVIKSVLYRMVMIPATLMVGGYVSYFFNFNVYTAPIVGFLVVKEILEYWKYKSLTQLHIASAAPETMQGA